MSTTEPVKPAVAPPPAAAPEAAESVLIRPWPKVVFFYPTFIVATILFLISALSSEQGHLGVAGLGNTFMLVFFLNLLVFAFDFSRIKSITLVIAAIAVVLLVAWLDTKWNVSGFLGKVLGSIDIRMNTAFFGWISGLFAFIFGLVLINSRFNYFEVDAREILHHHGYLGDVTRWPTDGLQMNKEINDLVEFLLLRSGRLVFLPQSAREAIVIDNVIGVNRIEDQVKDLLSIMAVRMNVRPGAG